MFEGRFVSKDSDQTETAPRKFKLHGQDRRQRFCDLRQALSRSRDVFMALRPASAQREMSGGVSCGFSCVRPANPAGPYRAINISPTTGRTYSTAADLLAPKASTKQQTRKRRQQVRQ